MLPIVLYTHVLSYVDTVTFFKCYREIQHSKSFASLRLSELFVNHVFDHVPFACYSWNFFRTFLQISSQYGWKLRSFVLNMENENTSLISLFSKFETKTFVMKSVLLNVLVRNVTQAFSASLEQLVLFDGPSFFWGIEKDTIKGIRDCVKLKHLHLSMSCDTSVDSATMVDISKTLSSTMVSFVLEKIPRGVCRNETSFREFLQYSQKYRWELKRFHIDRVFCLMGYEFVNNYGTVLRFARDVLQIFHKSLEEINMVYHCNFDDETLRRISCCPNVRGVRVSSQNLNDKHLLMLARDCNHLEELTLHRKTHFPNITFEGLLHFFMVAGSKSLQHIVISDAILDTPNFSTRHIEMLLRAAAGSFAQHTNSIHDNNIIPACDNSTTNINSDHPCLRRKIKQLVIKPYEDYNRNDILQQNQAIDKSLFATITHFESIDELHLYLSNDITDDLFEQLLLKTQIKNVIDLKSFTKITQKTILSIIQHCPSLTKLKLIDCDNVVINNDIVQHICTSSKITHFSFTSTASEICALELHAFSGNNADEKLFRYPKFKIDCIRGRKGSYYEVQLSPTR